MGDLTIGGGQQATGEIQELKRSGGLAVKAAPQPEEKGPDLGEDLHKLRPCPKGGFGINKVMFESPEQTVTSELGKLRKMGGDEYFGKQRQFDELKAFSARLNRRTDMNATNPDLAVWTTPTYAYSSKHLAAMREAIEQRMQEKCGCSGEERALLQGMLRAIDDAAESRALNRGEKLPSFEFEKPFLKY